MRLPSLELCKTRSVSTLRPRSLSDPPPAAHPPPLPLGAAAAGDGCSAVISEANFRAYSVSDSAPWPCGGCCCQVCLLTSLSQLQLVVASCTRPDTRHTTCTVCAQTIRLNRSAPRKATHPYTLAPHLGCPQRPTSALSATSSTLLGARTHPLQLKNRQKRR